MPLISRLSIAFLALATVGCLDLSGYAPFERDIQRTFKVSAGSLVEVDISGGSIRTRPGLPGVVNVTMHQRIFAGTESEADRALEGYDIAIRQAEGVVVVRARRKEGVTGWSLRQNHSFATTIEVPANVRLRLRTSGGSIDASGDRLADLDAATSGGSMNVDGGAGSIKLQTSGGSLRIGRALGALTASTSGGSIVVDYVGPDASAVDLDTSGGNIRASIDSDARFDFVAETSGGRVNLKDLGGLTSNHSRSRATATFNGGGHPFRAHTSGGNIDLQQDR